MTTDRPLLGILLMSAFCLLAPLADATAKLLTQTIPVIEIVTIRFGAQFLLLMPIVLLKKCDLRMNPRIVILLTLRTILHIIGISAMFLALMWMPLAETLAIVFVEPFLLLLLAWVILKEHVGPRRLMACAVGFGGALMVIQPSFSNVGAVALLPLVVALCFAFYMLITRPMVTKADPIMLQAISGGIALLILGPVLLLTSGSNVTALTMIWPAETDWSLLAALCLLGTFAQLLMTWSLRYAPSATLAPVQYLEIPVATLFGWVIFHDLPNGVAAVGILVTLGAGLYIVQHEYKASRQNSLMP